MRVLALAGLLATARAARCSSYCTSSCCSFSQPETECGDCDDTYQCHPGATCYDPADRPPAPPTYRTANGICEFICEKASCCGFSEPAKSCAGCEDPYICRPGAQCYDGTPAASGKHAARHQHSPKQAGAAATRKHAHSPETAKTRHEHTPAKVAEKKKKHAHTPKPAAAAATAVADEKAPATPPPRKKKHEHTPAAARNTSSSSAAATATAAADSTATAAAAASAAATTAPATSKADAKGPAPTEPELVDPPPSLRDAWREPSTAATASAAPGEGCGECEAKLAAAHARIASLQSELQRAEYFAASAMRACDDARGASASKATAAAPPATRGKKDEL